MKTALLSELTMPITEKQPSALILVLISKWHIYDLRENKQQELKIIDNRRVETEISNFEIVTIMVDR